MYRSTSNGVEPMTENESKLAMQVMMDRMLKEERESKGRTRNKFDSDDELNDRWDQTIGSKAAPAPAEQADTNAGPREKVTCMVHEVWDDDDESNVRRQRTDSATMNDEPVVAGTDESLNFSEKPLPYGETPESKSSRRARDKKHRKSQSDSDQPLQMKRVKGKKNTYVTVALKEDEDEADTPKVVRKAYSKRCVTCVNTAD